MKPGIRSTFKARLPGFCVSALLCAAPASAKTYRATTVDELKTMNNALVAGDSLAIAPGNYDLSSLYLTKKGTADKWIIVQGEPGAVLRSNSDCCNLVQVEGAAYVSFGGVELTLKDNNPGIDGIHYSAQYSHHIRMHDLKIHDLTGNGISMFPDSASDIELLNSEIANIEGSGLYWGYPGRNIIHDVLIQGNYIHHCPKNPATETDYGIQWKGWGYRARILNNVLHDVGGTTRSGLIVYYGKKPLAGDDPKDVNVVAGNVLWNCRSEGITVMSDARIENNIVFDAGTGINIQNYNDESFSGNSASENLTVRNNTVYRCRNRCFGISGWGDNATTNAFTGNAAYQESVGHTAIIGNVGKGSASGNVTFGISSLTGTLTGALGDFVKVTAVGTVPALDFYPAATSPLRDALDASLCAADDFNGTKRPQGKSCDAGAYEAGAAGNPGWGLKAGFKNGAGSAPVRARAPRAPGKGSSRKEMRRGAMLFAPTDAVGMVRSDGRLDPTPVAR